MRANKLNVEVMGTKPCNRCGVRDCKTPTQRTHTHLKKPNACVSIFTFFVFTFKIRIRYYIKRHVSTLGHIEIASKNFNWQTKVLVLVSDRA